MHDHLIPSQAVPIHATRCTAYAAAGTAHAALIHVTSHVVSCMHSCKQALTCLLFCTFFLTIFCRHDTGPAARPSLAAEYTGVCTQERLHTWHAGSHKGRKRVALTSYQIETSRRWQSAAVTASFVTVFSHIQRGSDA